MMTSRARIAVLFFAFSSVFSGFSTWAMPVELSNAPDNNLALTVRAIQSARKSILLNIYELTSPAIADALIVQIRAGVEVSVLEEGQPVGGMSAHGKAIQGEIVQTMNENDHFFVMTSKAGGK